VKNTIFWDAEPCTPEEFHRRFKRKSVCHLLLVGFLLVSLFDLEYEGNTSVRNVSELHPDYIALKIHKIIPFIIYAVFFAIMMDTGFGGHFKYTGQVKAKLSLGLIN
jgi:hypothetical protein